MGIRMNRQIWNLLGKEDRINEDNVRMINFPRASLSFEKINKKYDAVNEQRGKWMISHVYAVLKKGEEALIYAE